MTSSEAPPGLAALSKAFGLVVKDNKTNEEGAVVNGVKSDEKSKENIKEVIPEVDTKVLSAPLTNGVCAEEEKGSKSDIKNIYRSAKDGDGEWTWVDEYPKDVKEAAENGETEKFAVVVRNQKSKDSRKKLEAHSIVIQSPWLKKALGEILADYPGVTCDLQRLVFEAPFKPFVHRWSSFIQFKARKDLDEPTRKHIELLYEILKYEIGDDIKSFEDYVLKGVITFESLWMIFQPGCVVVSPFKGPMSAFELVDSEYIENKCGVFLRLQCDCVDWDGS